MAILNITLPEGAVVCNGKQVTFRAPCDCVGVTGIAIEGVTYALLDTTDAPVNSISAFVTGALVTVVLDTENNKAYIQNGSAAAAGVPRRVAVKLLASGWDSENSQIVDVLGLSVDETEQLVHIFPANNVVYAESGIVAETYEAGKLKFTAETIPTVDLDIAIIIEELGTQNPDAPSNVEFVAVDLPISSTVPTSHDVWVDPEDDGTVEVASNAAIKYKDPVTGDIKKIGGGGSGILVTDEIPDNVEVWIDPDEEDQTDNFYTMAQSDARFAGIDLSNVSNEDMLAKMQASGFSGGISMDLLWENASPASAFAAQTIAMDLSDYQKIYIECFAKTTELIVVSAIMPMDKTSSITFESKFYSSQDYAGGRWATPTQTGVTFIRGLNSNYDEDNSLIIPYRIYGLKGVQA